MGDSVHFRFKNVPEFEASLNHLAATIGTATGAAIEEAAKVLIADARRHIHNVSGALSSSFTVEVTKVGVTGYRAKIGPEAGSRAAPYARKVELGRKRSRRHGGKAHPYLRPAYHEVLPLWERLFHQAWAKELHR